MIKFKFRPSHERGARDHGWLEARFTFSFSDYYDPEHSGFHSLVVINNDIIQPKGGFGRHPHDNAEIFTYVISGELEHKDSMGNGSVIKPGNLQYMSAGDGVYHSEFNPSDSEKVELYQIWMLPNQPGGKPRYEEKKLGKDQVKNEVKILFSNDGRQDSTPIRQNATFSFGQLEQGNFFQLEPDQEKPNAWIQVISGSLTVGDCNLDRADGLGIENIDQPLTLEADQNCEFFIFRLAD
ncbi:MAG: pirin family protein [Opitutales bacterium]|nr:pirin family protein [Opitutales bacterium]